MIEIAGLAIHAGWLALVVVAACVGGFMRGFVGFGGALVLVPALSLALGPKMAVAIAGLVGLPPVLQLMPEAVRHGDRKLVAPATVTVAVGAPIGSLLLTVVDPRLMTGVIGIVVVLMALATRYGLSPRMAAPVWVPYLAGGIGGMLQGAAGIGGPPVVAVAMARGGEPRRQRASVLGLMAAISLLGAVSQWSFGLFTPQTLGLSLLLAPVYLGATWTGSRFFARGGQRHFRSAALALLIGIGCAAIVGALRG
ncbi:MAG: sulfite exporter TauE/SafE family protein [Hyphomicrobiaceae bacterium]|nr:sulfite exporter TauE/SafE family protein [Hyphomicrobiaceae bacterium]